MREVSMVMQKLEVDLTEPSLTASQAANKVTATASIKRSTGSKFGQVVSVSGDYMAISAPSEAVGSDIDTGAVYIFKRSGVIWELQQEIADKTGSLTRLADYDYFGWSISLDGDRLAVGAPFDDGPDAEEDDVGAVYVFKRTGSTWALEVEISKQTTNASSKIVNLSVLKDLDHFGRSVSLDGDRLAVGAPTDDGTNATDSGAAYIFKRTGSTWALEVEISKQTTANKIVGLSHLQAGDEFGTSLALDGDYLAIGAYLDDGPDDADDSGAVYIFKRGASTWSLEQEISNKTGSLTRLVIGDLFGSRVSLDGDRLAVGAPRDDGGVFTRSGAAYIFKRTGTTWSLEVEISKQTTNASSKILGLSRLEGNDLFGGRLPWTEIVQLWGLLEMTALVLQTQAPLTFLSEQALVGHQRQKFLKKPLMRAVRYWVCRLCKPMINLAPMLPQTESDWSLVPSKMTVLVFQIQAQLIS